MKSTVMRAATILALVVVGSTLIAAGRGWTVPAVTLVKEGAPQMALVAGSVSEPVAELQRCLARMTGTELSAVQPRPGAQGVYVGLAADFPWLGLSNADLRELGGEGFILRSDGMNLLLIANQPAGVQHAVVTLLHSLGCRWFFPGSEWEIIPQRPTVAGAWDERGRPSFSMQRKIWYGYGAYRPCAEAFAAWERHNRMGGPVTVSIGHTSQGLDYKADFARHPEWFALVQGERKATKPCYSHPAVVEQAIRYALDRAARGGSMISLSPPDGLGYCECERCFAVFQGAKPYAEYGSWFAKRPDGAVVNVTSETLFALINQVAAAVAEKHPETLIGCYAYSAYSHPPSFKIHSNVFLQTTTAYRRTGLSLEEQLEAWSRCASQIGIRDYYSVYQWDWDYPQVGKLKPADLQKGLQFFRRQGVTSINAEASNNWAARGLGYYLAAQLMWDVNADVPALIRDFYTRAFGPAAGVMERYYVRWYGPAAATAEGQKRTASSPAEDEIANDRAAAGLSVESLKAAFRDLEEAARLVKDSPEHLARVNQLRLYWHYLYLRHRLDEAEKSKNEAAILIAIRDELTFGGRLAHANIIHARPLIGKAMLRRFKKFESLLAPRPEVQKENQGWRQIGSQPSPAELEQLWQAGLGELGLKVPGK